MGQEGSVAWQFTRKSFFNIPCRDYTYDDLFKIAVETVADILLEREEFLELILVLATLLTIQYLTYHLS